MIVPLNLPTAELRLKKIKSIVHVWCLIRNQFLVCTPEEWVRQHYINFLINYKGYPKGRIASEFPLEYNGRKKRADIVVFDAYSNPLVIIECKAPEVPLNQDTLHQIAQYQFELKTVLLGMTNGLEHVYLIPGQKKGSSWIKELPEYKNLNSIPQA